MTLLNMKLTLKNLESWQLKRSVLSKSITMAVHYWLVAVRPEQSTTSDALGAYMGSKQTHM